MAIIIICVMTDACITDWLQEFSEMANFVRHLREKLYMHDTVKLEACKSYVSARIWILQYCCFNFQAFILWKLQSDMTQKIIKQVCVYELEQYTEITLFGSGSRVVVLCVDFRSWVNVQ